MNEQQRIARIAELMELDPALGTPEGDELNRLVDEQMEFEKGLLDDYPDEDCGDPI